MRQLQNITDRKLIFRIGYVRAAFSSMSRSFKRLRETLEMVEKTGVTIGLTMAALDDAWLYIDHAFRFAKGVGQIKGLKHSDPRFKLAQRDIIQLEKARNYTQHLDSELMDLPETSYPVLGVISWSSDNGQCSLTISLGALPTGTEIHSLPFDQNTGAYVPNIILNAGNFSVDISRSMAVQSKCHDYLEEWLLSSDMLSSDDLGAFILSIPKISAGVSKKRYQRLLMKVQ